MIDSARMSGNRFVMPADEIISSLNLAPHPEGGWFRETWRAPAVGGPVSRQLTRDMREIDWQARLTISRELGHEREQITAVYLGR